LKDIIEIANQFKINNNVINIQEYGNGNINKTYLITTDKENNKYFILQRINTDVFLKPESVMQNMCIVTEHIHKRIQSSDVTSIYNWKVPRIIQTHANQNYWIAPDKTFWRTISFIENSQCFDTIDNTDIAIEIGCALGIFHNLISDLPTKKLTDTLEGFHITPHYINHYDQVMKDKRVDNSHEINYCIKFVNKRRLLANILEDAKTKGKLPLRIMHGDPKINNIMIEKDTRKAISIIDLDTVKPGLIHYDIGDCLRSGCNPLGEEAGVKWESVYFDTNNCRSILQGYISQAKSFLIKNDYKYLYDSIRLIAFELGLRFFTDYLEGNVYFHAEYPEHNLFRSLVQFKLTESIEFYEANIKNIIKDIK
jgi:Ser/Thr protein kinase RdoA (MazF antagonist)